MPENRSGIPQINLWKKISLWNFFDFVPKSPVFQSSVKKIMNQYLILEKDNVLYILIMAFDSQTDL